MTGIFPTSQGVQILEPGIKFFLELLPSSSGIPPTPHVLNVRAFCRSLGEERTPLGDGARHGATWATRGRLFNRRTGGRLIPEYPDRFLLNPESG